MKGYLELPYFNYPYLTGIEDGVLGLQVEFRVNTKDPVNTEIVYTIADVPASRKMQFEGKITKPRSVGIQFNRVRINVVKTQIAYSLYNTTNLRILYDFSSRGSGANAGVNWTASTQATGDFSVNNLNTDITEQVWRSASGQKTGVILTCDTGVTQGVFVDTFAMLGHNLTTSANVILQGSDQSNFTSVGFEEVIPVTGADTYWIAPTLPSDSFRYWRLLLTDPTNTDNFLEIGSVVFGKAIIFQGDNIVDEVTRSTKHFADKIETEGFTNVTVDRAVKSAVGLEFKNWAYLNGNYNKIRAFFDACRTGLKALWIPTPQYPERFAVFGKLTAIPTERHNVKGEDLDFVDFTVEVDESL